VFPPDVPEGGRLREYQDIRQGIVSEMLESEEYRRKEYSFAKKKRSSERSPDRVPRFILWINSRFGSPELFFASVMKNIELRIHATTRINQAAKSGHLTMPTILRFVNPKAERGRVGRRRGPGFA
jgi:hypothetical protein